MKYFLYKDDQPAGPFGDTEITGMLGRGEIAGTDLVCAEGGNEWVPAGTVFSSAPNPNSPAASSVPPPPQAPATNTNLDREWQLYEAYSNEIDGLTDLLGEVDERQAKDIHKQIEHKLAICQKHIASIEPHYPHSIEVKSMKADYLFNCAVKKLWEHGFYHRAAVSQLEKGSASRSLTRLGFAAASRVLANQKEKTNANDALNLLSQSLGFLDSPGTRLAKANVHVALGQKDAAVKLPILGPLQNTGFR